MILEKQIKAIVREALRLFAAQLINVIREVLREELETAEEKWLSQEDLINQFGCFSKRWLSRNGDSLPRTKPGSSNRWGYPMHKINRMLQDGTIKNL